MIPAIALIASLIQLAPDLSKIFKGSENVQAVAETAAEVARTVTGTSTNDSALQVLKANPDKLLEFQQSIISQQTEFERLYQADKESARNRDIEFLKAGKINYRANFLVAVSVSIVIAILFVVIQLPNINEYAKGVITTILGVFLNQLTNIFSFEFGTTRKGEDKQSAITADYIRK